MDRNSLRFGYCDARPIFVAVASERSVQPPNRLGPLLLAQAGLVAIVAAVLAVVFFWEHNSASSIGLKPLTLQSFAWGLALAVFFMYAVSPVAYWTFRRFRLGGFDKGLSQLQGLPVWYLVLAVVIGGVAEEILYRGYAIERIATLTGSLWLAGAIPVVVFAVAHVPMWGGAPPSLRWCRARSSRSSICGNAILRHASLLT